MGNGGSKTPRIVQEAIDQQSTSFVWQYKKFDLDRLPAEFWLLPLRSLTIKNAPNLIARRCFFGNLYKMARQLN